MAAFSTSNSVKAFMVMGFMRGHSIFLNIMLTTNLKSVICSMRNQARKVLRRSWNKVQGGSPAGKWHLILVGELQLLFP